MALKGYNKIAKNLNDQIKAIKNKTMGGLLAGGLIIEREAKKRVPVEYGNLRASGYTRKHENGGLAVQVGFTAAYALWVHENYDAKWKGKPRKSGVGVYWGPAGEPGFLVNAMRYKSREVVDAVRTRARVK